MKKFYFLIAALGMAGALSSQTPVNDDCSGLIDLGTAPICTPTVYSNVGATPTDIGNDNNPTCFNSGTAQRDVWFMFTCPDTLFDFRITLTGVGNSILNPEFAVYRGDCEFDGLAELLCAKADLGENTLFLDVTGLTPGLQYFIRVSDYSPTGTPNSGEFTLCVDKIPPIVTIDQGSSSLCEGTLYDSGGPNGDYAANEGYTFVICPNQPSACITFTLEYYNIEEGNFSNPGDVLTFYNGDNINAPVITAINSGDFLEPVGGGGVGFQIQATSGCLTVQFTSDESVEFEGWKGHWICDGTPCEIPESIAIDTNITSNEIVNAISTPLTTVTITNINCPARGYGIFSFPTDDNNELGMSKGLILTSGDAVNAIGPNSFTGLGTLLEPFAFGIPPDEGDADLNYLSDQLGTGTPSYDACVVELDVYANTDELVFEYIFASEEYPEYANSNFNDIFAFLISGPGIAGDPGLGGAKNIAVLPFTTTPVQINSVNHQINWQYYRNNQGNQTLAQVIEYDGLTTDSLGIKKSLTARSAVIPCNTYHLKLAIADRQDEAFDSGVFISDIKAGSPDMTVQFAGGVDYLTENCLVGVPNALYISIPKPLDHPTSYNVNVGGTATPGVDYTANIPAVITFQPGQTTLAFPITPISDVLTEGTETITIQLFNDYGCGPVILKTLVIELREKAEVVVLGGDTLFVCGNGTLQLQAKGADDYFWAPPGAVSDPFIANPTITPTQNIWLNVTGTLGICTDVDSVFVQIIAPQVDVVALSDVNVCQGTPVLLQAINNVNNTGILWTPAATLDDKYSATPTATPLQTTTYTATITVGACSVSDQITVHVDTLFFPQLINDTALCQNYPVQLGSELNSTTDYQWTPSAGLSNPNVSGPVALPDATTTYTLTATSANGYCTQTESVTVTVTPADVDIAGDSFIELCLGDTAALTAQVSPGSAQQVAWSPAFYLSNTSGPNTTASPDESITVTATYIINGCIVRDSVRLRVDSLPDQSIMRVEDKSIYCPGDTVYLISPTYEPANFPDIEIEWLPFGGQETPLDLWNMVITATVTHTFERVVTNRGCKDTATVEVPVGVIPTLIPDAMPKQICPGESSQITVLVDPPGTKLEWQDMPPTLSCTDCSNPTATPIVTTTYTLTTPEADCPSSTSVTIEVLPPPSLNLPVNPSICADGPGVQLNSIAESGVTYTWTPSTGLDDPFSATPTAKPSATTTYMVIANGPICDAEGTVTVTVDDATIDAGANQTICSGETATLTATVTGTPGTITWTPGNQTGQTISVSPTETTVYSATLAYGSGCSDNDVLTVTVSKGPSLSELSAEPGNSDSICIGVPITLQVGVTPGDADLVWTQDNVAIPGTEGDSVTFIPQVDIGSADFAVIATDASGCTSTRTIRYDFKRCAVVPNAFTPGTDGVNDTFGPLLFGSNTVVQTFQVYNRWGTKVFEATPGKQRWDGKHKGDDAPSDIYVYYIVLRYANGTEETLKGDVALLR